ncbi:hypothetical protein BLA24_00480 [Streptomyces cinnamoneus]|uniref:HTH cro/C1-type domain-containing protein n=1 Tax=Streptomyces cinnamoneus TaxID=53446 RepID=A0A2G1XQC7_STRCJ|nr:helix-turn-helix transcriptional regulator [Streptomyces cinnamoneus]PHQ53445.1 hypothetical protein BLA24_00480 [Streptomyces cinnamoneus]PPT12750.1 XRE family transcriptional regulator [Streptomyces cinnamoneus]
MTEFASRAREALAARGLSMRGAARALCYDPAYLSRVLNGKQCPSPQLAGALDALVGAEGALAGLLPPGAALRVDTAPENTDSDLGHLRATVAYLLDHDNRYGGDAIAPAAVRVWKTAQRKLDTGSVPDRLKCEYLTAVAELAQVAGWLLFDAGQQDAARSAFLEARILAGHAGDRSREWFVLDLLAMQGVEHGRTGESLRIADELLSQLRLPPRVALMARVRKARALADAGHRQGALNELKAARAALEDSISPCDPSWTWWINELEIAGHEGEALRALGDDGAAVPQLQRAHDLSVEFRPSGRGVLYYKISLLSAYTAIEDWPACEAMLHSLPAVLDVVSSGRNHRRLRGALQGVTRAPHAPHWLTDLARDVASTPQLSVA